MDYLKREIFYPLRGNADDEVIHKTISAYNEYIASIKDKLPKKLLKTYFDEDEFNDYVIRELLIVGNARCYSKNSDEIIIKLCLGKTEIDLYFNDISFLKLEMENNKSCWTIIHNERQSDKSLIGIEEIVLCELGLVKDNLFKFEFVTSSGANVVIQFSKIKILKKVRDF